MHFKLNINDDGHVIGYFSEESRNFGKSNNIESNPHPGEKNTQNEKDKSIKDPSNNQRSKRKIKKIQHEDSFTSEGYEESPSDESLGMNINEKHFSENVDIVMEGNLLYRYSSDQIELEGYWTITSELVRENFSYLLLKKKERIQCGIKKNSIDYTSYDNNSQMALQNYFTKEDYVVNICSANLFELLLIPNSELFSNILHYLTGEYHGFFMYYGKTIEDRFFLNFSLEDNQVRVNGEGTNSLGNFNIIGYINFFTIKDEMLRKNDMESEIINLGEFKMTRLYNAFNPNENYRVIKSYQHRRKKQDGSDNSSA